MSEEQVDDHGVFDAAVEEPQSSDTPTQQSDSQQPAQAAPQSSGIDPKVLADAIAQGMSNVQASQQPKQPQLTDEEVKQRLREFSYNEDFAKALAEELRADEPDAKAISTLLNTAHQSQMQQAQTFAYLMAQQIKQELSQQFQPAIEYATKAQKEAGQKRFFDSYPALKPYEKLIPLVAQSLQSQGVQHADEKSAFEALAKAAETHIKSMQPGFSLAAQQQQAQQQRATTPNTVSFGGQGGVGNQPNSTPKGSGIWD